MLKFTLFTLLVLGVGTLYNNTINTTSFGSSISEIGNSEESVLNFSYDMNVLKYWQPVNESDRNSLKDFQKFALIPQKESMKVKGSLSSSGTPYLEVEYIQREFRPRVQMNGKGHQFAHVHRVIMNNNEIISLDKEGKELLRMDIDEIKHLDLAKNILNKIEPEESLKSFLKDSESQGWKINQNDHTLHMTKEEGDDHHTLLFDNENALPVFSKLVTEREIVTTNYKYECIDGRYVLVMQRTSVIKKHIDYDQPMMEYISLVELDNIIFNS